MAKYSTATRPETPAARRHAGSSTEQLAAGARLSSLDVESALASSRDERERVRAYYEASSLDYRYWSRNFHMHFGFFRWGMNPFSRESMLVEMNRQVFSRLNLAENTACRVADLGCGLGAPARDAARRFPRWSIDAVSLVPWQVEYATELTRSQGGAENLRFTVSDYTSTPFDDRSFDGAYALESSCHASGDDKHDFVREAARLLKPGAHLVVADGFIEREPVPWPISAVLRSVYKNWALPRFANRAAFIRALELHGFDVLESEDVSYRIAPSALHVPWVTLRFLLATLTQKVSRVRWGHVFASILSPLVGAARPFFKYRMLVARRRAE
jgi:MPBQ/MSBQ methyltransferase